MSGFVVMSNLWRCQIQAVRWLSESSSGSCLIAEVTLMLAISDRCVFTYYRFHVFVNQYLLTTDKIHSSHQCRYIIFYTGRFIMFSVVTDIYSKKTKGPTLMELFTATGKLKKFFFDNWKCSMCAPQVTQQTSIRYSSVSCHLWCTHQTFLVAKKKKKTFSVILWLWTIPLR